MSDSQGYDPYVHDPHGAVGAYVADALDDDERTVFEQHLAGCDSCRREVAEFTETMAEMTWLSEATPPPSLRTSVLWQIATVRPLPPEQPLETPGSPVSPGWWASAGASSAGSPRGAAPGLPAMDPEVTVERRQVDELAARRQRRTRRVLTGLVAAALVLVVGLGGWVAALRGNQQNQQVATQQVNDLLTAPDAKLYTTQLDGANVSYVVSKERNQAVFLGDNLQPPGDDKVYQVWTIQGKQPTSQGLVEGTGAVTHWFDAPVDGAQVMAITIEPAGGSPAPTTTPLAAVEL